jgi:hypothetical protein
MQVCLVIRAEQLERTIYVLNLSSLVVKGKAIPLQAWTDREGYRRLRLPDFKTIDI